MTDECAFEQGAANDVGMDDARLIAHLRDELAHISKVVAGLESALASSRLIGTAVGILMFSLKISRDAAFALLSQTSQRANVKLRDIADQVVETGALPDAGALYLRVIRRPAPGSETDMSEIPPTEHIDIARYHVELTQTSSGLTADVMDLPGCVAAAPTAVELTAALRQAIYLHLETHPDAPRYYVQ